MDALIKTVPWFFALDHTHYTRWIPVHLHDMVTHHVMQMDSYPYGIVSVIKREEPRLVTLETRHPNVFAALLKGKFAVKKTSHAFSAIAIDQPTSRTMPA